MGELIVPASTVQRELAGFLDAHALTQRAFAAAIGVSEKHLSMMMRCRVGMTSSLALTLETGTGIPAGVWAALQVEEQVRAVRVSQGMRRRARDVRARLRELEAVGADRRRRARRQGTASAPAGPVAVVPAVCERVAARQVSPATTSRRSVIAAMTDLAAREAELADQCPPTDRDQHVRMALAYQDAAAVLLTAAGRGAAA